MRKKAATSGFARKGWAQKLSRGQRLWRAGLSLLMFCGLMVLRYVNPEQQGFSLTMPLTQRVFGLPCPFCGMTRGTHALLNGEIMRALYFNFATVLIFLIVVFLLVLWLVEAGWGRSVVQVTGWVDRIFCRWKLLLGLVALFWMVHLTLAIRMPKPELLHPEAPWFPSFILPE